MKLIIAFLIGSFLYSAPAHAVNKYSKDFFGENIVHNAVFEDTLIHLARRNGMGFVELRAANPTLDPWIPGKDENIIFPKQHLLPDAPRDGLVINLAEMRVFYFKEQNEAPLTFPISIGREGLQTPTGSTKIVRKKDGPTWRPTKRMRDEDPSLPVSVPPGPQNPLGTHALYLGWPQYLMHGTNKPYGIGRRVSSGCMRMYPEDIKELFPQVPVGTPVTVVDQPVKVGWIGEGLHIEVSPNQDQSLIIEENGDVKPFEITQEDKQRIIRKAGAHTDKIDWGAVNKAVQEYRGYPVEIMNLKGAPKPSLEAVLNEKKQQADTIKAQAEAKAELEAAKVEAQKATIYEQAQTALPEPAVITNIAHPKTTVNIKFND